MRLAAVLKVINDGGSVRKSEYCMARWRLTELKLQSDRVLKYRIALGGKSAQLRVGPGRTVVLDGSLHESAR